MEEKKFPYHFHLIIRENKNYEQGIKKSFLKKQNNDNNNK
jgi:hypothetical protein